MFNALSNEGVVVKLDPEIEGLWRKVPQIEMEPGYPSENWRYLFKSGVYKEIIPDMVDTGELRCTYRTNMTTNPKQLLITMDWNGPDGPPDPNAMTQHWIYKIDGDKLTLKCAPVGGDLPDSFEEGVAGGIEIYQRDNGPIPKNREPSNTPSLRDPLLGELKFHDNFNSYEGKIVRDQREISIRLRILPDGELKTVLDRARNVVRNYADYVSLASDFATEELLGIKNEFWIDHEADEPEVSAEEFRQRLELILIAFDSRGTVSFEYLDGDLFLGHHVSLRIDSNDRWWIQF